MSKITISISMVSLNCWKVIKGCQKSLRPTGPSIQYEVIVVDKCSSDGAANLKTIPGNPPYNLGHFQYFSRIRTGEAIVEKNGQCNDIPSTGSVLAADWLS
jgi:hypothetical protein